MSTTAPPRRPRGTPPRLAGRPPVSARAARAEAARFRRALVLLLGSLVAPGSAQVVAGSRRVGVWALRVWALVLVVVLLVWQLVPLETLIGLAVRPGLLSAFRVLAFGLAAAWVLLLLDAWRLGAPPSLRRGHRVVVLVLTVALCALLVYPAVTAARYAAAARDAVVALFPSGQAAVASDGRLNVLLVGADAGDGRVGLRPDSLHLVSVDVQTGRPVMFSLPRNLELARFAEGTPAAEAFPRGFTGEGERSDYLLNATWTYAEDNPELFPGPAGPGPTAVKEAVAGTLGVPVHYYVLVDLQGFRDIVDALGGVTLTVPSELPIGNKGRVLEPGEQRLDGYETLWFARSREGTSDYDRMARQRCVVDAVLREADPATVLRNFTELAGTATALLQTDIPQQQLGELVDLALEAKRQALTAVQFVPPLIVPADPDIDLIHRTVEETMSAARATPPAATASTPAPTAGTADPEAAPPAAQAVETDTTATEDVTSACG